MYVGISIYIYCKIFPWKSNFLFANQIAIYIHWNGRGGKKKKTEGQRESSEKHKLSPFLFYLFFMWRMYIFVTRRHTVYTFSNEPIVHLHIHYTFSNNILLKIFFWCLRNVLFYLSVYIWVYCFGDNLRMNWYRFFFFSTLFCYLKLNIVPENISSIGKGYGMNIYNNKTM